VNSEKLDAAYVDSYQLVESNQVYQVSVVGRVAVDSSWQAKLKTGFDVATFVIRPLAKVPFALLREKGKGQRVKESFFPFTFSLSPFPYFCKKSIDWDKQLVQCPQGNLSHSWREGYDCRKNPVIQVEFDRLSLRGLSSEK
jgi:transposase